MTALQLLDLETLHQPTHTLRTIVTAWRIVAADELASDRRLTVLVEGEPAHAEVPPGFCDLGTPVTGDWLILNAVGEVSHMRADVFEAVALAEPRANSGCLGELPRVPRFPG